MSELQQRPCPFCRSDEAVVQSFRYRIAERFRASWSWEFPDEDDHQYASVTTQRSLQCADSIIDEIAAALRAHMKEGK